MVIVRFTLFSVLILEKNRISANHLESNLSYVALRYLSLLTAYSPYNLLDINCKDFIFYPVPLKIGQKNKRILKKAQQEGEFPLLLSFFYMINHRKHLFVFSHNAKSLIFYLTNSYDISKDAIGAYNPKGPHRNRATPCSIHQ